MIPAGKNMFIWRCENVAGGDANAAVDAALAMGLGGVSFKVSGGPYEYSYNAPHLKTWVPAFRNAGMLVGGWGYIWSNEPGAEAAIAKQMVDKYALDWFTIDAEADSKNKPDQAKAYMNELRERLPYFAIGLTSYRYPELHPELPWKEFLADCDFGVPQVYWNKPYADKYGPIPELRKTIEQWRKITKIPIIPAGRAYNGDGYTALQPSELTDFMGAAVGHDLPGVTFWSFDHTYTQAGGDARRTAIGNFHWEGTEKEITTEEKVDRLWEAHPDLW